MTHDDPRRQEHYIEVARLSAPPPPRPGSVGSGRFGVFEKTVWAGSLNFNEGTWIELELIEPDSGMFNPYTYMEMESSESEGSVVQSLLTIGVRQFNVMVFAWILTGTTSLMKLIS